ncbi:Trp biosynthesis-associated membrane protein [Actinoplanes sp. NPDC049596]|uniref:Trp biosynthesis-associated membrane protein n=1 Tax=unclassified Actinoplanes TaxID=2626549 RepID=UPI0034169723
MNHRRSYLLTLLACLAGAGLAAYAATRTWSLDVVHRPAMSDVRTPQTGADLEPWLIGLALAALAGTGALLATHGWVRRGLGVLLTLAGLGVVIGAIAGRAGLDVGEAGAGATVWPVACALGGAIIAAGGLTAARQGHLWSRMSARYERKPTQEQASAPGVTTQPGDPSGPLAASGLKTSDKPVDNRAAWDALDRGDDPTS